MSTLLIPRDPRGRLPRLTVVEGDLVAMIPLTNGRQAIVDIFDLPIVQQRCWSLARGVKRYARAFGGIRDGKPFQVTMHSLILTVPDDLEVDHRNGNHLDNRRRNLRPATHQQNMCNMKPHVGCTSKYKGVSWYRRDQKWRAYIVVNARQKHLGYFDDEIEAAQTYDKAAIVMFGEFARLNFPKETDRGT